MIICEKPLASFAIAVGWSLLDQEQRSSGIVFTFGSCSLIELATSVKYPRRQDLAKYSELNPNLFAQRVCRIQYILVPGVLGRISSEGELNARRDACK